MSKQKLSLQDQLLQSGLVSSAKAKTVKTEQRKKSQQQRKNTIAKADETKLLAQQAQAEKAEKDRAANLKRDQEEARKALAAQIKQLVAAHRIANTDHPDGEPFRFTDQNKVKTLYLDASSRRSLIAGEAAIVKQGNGYALVSLEGAEKIRTRSPGSIVLLHSKQTAEEDCHDAYAAYRVPDDLLW